MDTNIRRERVFLTNTKAAPSAVTNQVKRVANSACRMGGNEERKAVIR
jgi:hypothetical protein